MRKVLRTGAPGAPQVRGVGVLPRAREDGVAPGGRGGAGAKSAFVHRGDDLLHPGLSPLEANLTDDFLEIVIRQ